jgi:hypothetical protein
MVGLHTFQFPLTTGVFSMFDFISEIFNPILKVDNKIAIKLLNEIARKSYKLPAGKVIKLNLRNPKRKFNYQQLCKMIYRDDEPRLGSKTILLFPIHNQSYNIYRLENEYPDSFYIDPTDKKGLMYPIKLSQRGYLLLHELEEEEKKMKYRKDETRYGLISLIISGATFLFVFHHQLMQVGRWLFSLFRYQLFTLFRAFRVFRVQYF